MQKQLRATRLGHMLVKVGVRAQFFKGILTV